MYDVHCTTYNVRPLIKSDYSICNPDPLYITNSNNIENIQKYFTKRLFARCNIPKCFYTDRLIFSINYISIYIYI